jgi:hypothetical protein
MIEGEIIMNKELFDKIIKLLAKAEGTSNEHEAQAFLNKAQQLMAQNNIKEEDLEAVNLKKEERIGQEDIIDDRATSARNIYLANIVAENFKVKVFKHNEKLVFMGLEDDLTIAKMTFQAIHTFMERRRRQIYKEAQKAGLPTKGIREDYVQGFLRGLAEGFKKNVQEYGLMVITPQTVVDQFNELMSGSKQTKARSGGSAGNKEMFRRGYEDGKGYGKVIE